jgi:hypothetical protein
MGAPHKMGDTMLGQGVEDRARPHPAQADMGAATADSDQGMHQPLQWNIGRVQSSTGCSTMVPASALP